MKREQDILFLAYGNLKETINCNSKPIFQQKKSMQLNTFEPFSWTKNRLIAFPALKSDACSPHFERLQFFCHAPGRTTCFPVLDQAA